MANSENVQELRIIYSDNNTNIFSENKYVIPLYQRAFAWKETQLVQLIEDIRDISDTTVKYYIGSLVVSKLLGEPAKYEVIDGQQRLTSLFMLLKCLQQKGSLENQKIGQNLTFACRERSNITLKNIGNILNGKTDNLEHLESNIEKGLEVLKEQIDKLEKEDKLDPFIEHLTKIVIYRIEVPVHTDLNRYFEIMNTRGEQLEQADVLKARLMGYLNVDENATDEEKIAAKNDMNVFAEIWDACSDMSGYIQMHFKTGRRDQIFTKDKDTWRECPSVKWQDYKLEPKQKNNNTSTEALDSSTPEPTIDWIINNNPTANNYDGFDEQDVRVRFESIISFPYFLLHTLKVYINLNKIKHKIDGKKIVDDLLDDKKLLEAFMRVVDNGVTEQGTFPIDKNKKEFSKNFVMLLLKTRFLFDRYFIKREFSDKNLEGEWSLKDLYVSDDTRKPYYKRTVFSNDDKDNSLNSNNLMLQSALRVSYTSPKIMHWITSLLIWLNSEQNMNNINSFSKDTENLIKKAVNDDFLKTENYSLGVDTPHIAFNYLDYLLWKMRDKNEYQIDTNNFKFEFRNSVEHWYPQHPSEGSFPGWSKNEGLDSFGNLCLVQRNINSKFSNLSPEAKKSTYEEMINKGSLKLRIMSKLTEHINASINWRESICDKHHKEMIGLLKKACDNQE